MTYPQSTASFIADYGDLCQLRKDRQNISLCQEYNVSCIEKNCKGIGENDNAKPSLCAKQAKPFFMNPEGYTKQGSSLLLINGQFEPTLTITADTWVRLRLGFLATGMIL